MQTLGLLQNTLLNLSYPIHSTVPAKTLWKTITHLQNESGNVLTKLFLIKEFENLLDEKFINATGEQIKKMNDPELRTGACQCPDDIGVECKIFVGKMIADIYEKINKMEIDTRMFMRDNSQESITKNINNFMTFEFLKECVNTITKEDFSKKVIEYINELSELNDDMSIINNGIELFNILIDVYYDMVLTNYETTTKELPKEQITQYTDGYFTTLNNIFSYNPKYYDDDYNNEDITDDSSGSGDEQDQPLPISNDQIQNSLKRKNDDDNPITNNKKSKFTL